MGYRGQISSLHLRLKTFSCPRVVYTGNLVDLLKCSLAVDVEGLSQLDFCQRIISKSIRDMYPQNGAVWARKKKITQSFLAYL